MGCEDVVAQLSCVETLVKEEACWTNGHSVIFTREKTLDSKAVLQDLAAGTVSV